MASGSGSLESQLSNRQQALQARARPRAAPCS
jgi:hypothetical protein